MKTKLTSLSLLIMIAFVTGCASGPTYQEYVSNIPPLANDKGRIYIYRTAAFGAAVQPAVKVNGEITEKAVPQGFFFVDRPVGTYEISTSTEAERSASITLAAGEEKYIRLEVKMGVFAGHVKPVLVDAAVGKEEIKKTKYIGL